MWPKLNEPDVYKPKKGDPKIRYTTQGKLEPEDLKKVMAYLEGIAAKLLPDVKSPKLPFKEDKKTGEMLISASSGEKYRPPVYDAKNGRIPPSVVIGGGSKARIDVSVNAFEISRDNSGLNLYINSVQVLDLQEGGFKSNFEEAEGFTYKGAADSGQAAEDHNDDEDSTFVF